MEESAILAASSTATASAPASDVVPGSQTAPHAPLHQYFGVAPGDAIQEAQLAKIWEFAVVRAGSEDADTVVETIRAMRHALGIGYLGDRPWMKLAAYVTAVGDLKQAESNLRDLTA